MLNTDVRSVQHSSLVDVDYLARSLLKTPLVHLPQQWGSQDGTSAGDANDSGTLLGPEGSGIVRQTWFDERF